MLNDAAIERSDWVSPPGETILSVLEERELTIEQFAASMGMSLLEANDILDGKTAIGSHLACLLSEKIGSSESFWLAREHDYRACFGPSEHASVSSLEKLVEELPIRDMRRFGWISAQNSRKEKVAECLEFFGVSSLAQWQGRYENAFLGAAYRQSNTFPNCEVPTVAWLRQGELQTLEVSVSKWSPGTLAEQLDAFRRFTWYKRPSIFLPKLESLLAKSGVKFAVVRAPKGCTASGAVRLLQDGTPLLQMSFRHLSDDQFWFSFFHEIAHLLLHFDQMPKLESSGLTQDECEQEANEFASGVIVPMKFRDELLSLGASRSSILAFARKVGVAPGLIVGQLQYERILRFNQMQHLKRRFRWSDHPRK